MDIAYRQNSPVSRTHARQIIDLDLDSAASSVRAMHRITLRCKLLFDVKRCASI